MERKSCFFYAVILSFLLLCQVLLMTGCQKMYQETDEVFAVQKTFTMSPSFEARPTIAPEITPSLTALPTPLPIPSPTPTPIPISEVSLVAIGDDLMHQTLIDGCKKKDGSYDFNCLFLHLKDKFAAADLAVINQESILGGNQTKYSGYPCFNSPDALGDAIVAAGFDVVLAANNHVLDRSILGLKHSISYWDKHPEITLLGVHKSEEESNQVSYIEKNGIRIALFNFTYGMNGFSLPKGKEYMVDTLSQRDKIKRLMKEAKEQSDFVIVFPHWGTEYKYQPNSYQKDMAQFLSECGADLIIGTHPHVLQPVTYINDHKTLVYYSLGNYASTMDDTDRMLGGMAEVTIEKKDGVTRIKKASLAPIVMHYESGQNKNFGVYSLKDYTKEQARHHAILPGTRGNDFSVSQMKRLVEQIITKEWCSDAESIYEE